jgi:WD40 repeat protein
MFVLKGPEAPVVLSLAFSPDAAKLYAVHVGDCVHVWNLAEQSGRWFEIDGGSVHGELLIHPNGRWAFGLHRSVDTCSCCIDLNTLRVKPFDFAYRWDHCALSPDGRRVVTIVRSDPRKGTDSLRGWRMTSTGPRAVWQRKAPKAVPCAVTFVGNDTLVTLDQMLLRYVKTTRSFQSSRLVVRSATDGRIVTTLDSPAQGSESPHLLAPPDGKWFVMRRGTETSVWDATNWKKPPTVIAGKDANLRRAAAFHPSGRSLLLANKTPSVVVLDTTTWKQVQKWNWKIGELRAVAVSPDGTLAAAAGTNNRIVVWDWDL